MALELLLNNAAAGAWGDLTKFPNQDKPGKPGLEPRQLAGKVASGYQHRGHPTYETHSIKVQERTPHFQWLSLFLVCFLFHKTTDSHIPKF